MQISTRTAAADIRTLEIVDGWLENISRVLEGPGYGPAERDWLDRREDDLRQWRAALRREKFTPEQLAARARLVAVARLLQDLPRHHDGTISFTLWRMPGSERCELGVRQ